MNRSISGNSLLGDGRSVRPSSAPSVDQGPDPVNVVGIGIEYRIDVSRGPHHSVADQGDPANQHIADARAVEILKDASESGQRADARSAAWRLRAIPSASRSSGSRDASLIRRYRRHSSPARASSPWASALRARAAASVSRSSEDNPAIRVRIAPSSAADAVVFMGAALQSSYVVVADHDQVDRSTDITERFSEAHELPVVALELRLDHQEIKVASRTCGSLGVGAEQDHPRVLPGRGRKNLSGLLDISSPPPHQDRAMVRIQPIASASRTAAPKTKARTVAAATTRTGGPPWMPVRWTAACPLPRAIR